MQDVKKLQHLGFKLFKKVILIISIFILSLCANDNDIRYSIKKKLQSTYPTMQIHHLAIQRLTTLPRGFKNYKQKAIYISKASLKNSHGTFYVEYTNGVKIRKIFYKFQIDAKISLFVASSDIPRKTEIDESYVDFKEVEFDHISFKPIDERYLHGYLTKRDIKKGAIITTKDLSIKPDIKRGDILNASLYSDGIIVNFSVKAMQDGRIGDIIRVNKDHKKIFKARIVSNSSVEIVD